MAHTEMDCFRQALSTQGTQVGQQKKVIQDMIETLLSLTTSVAELGIRLEQVASHISSFSTSSGSSPAGWFSIPAFVNEMHQGFGR